MLMHPMEAWHSILQISMQGPERIESMQLNRLQLSMRLKYDFRII